MLDSKHMKIAGYVFTGLSLLIGIGTNWLAEQKQEQLISEKVAEKVTEVIAKQTETNT